MKKLFTFFLGLMLSVSLVPAQEYWNQYLINETFDGWIALPTGWSSSSLGGSAFTVGDSLRFSGSGSGNRGTHLLIPVAPDSSAIYLDFDLRVAASSIARNNAYVLYFTGSKSTNFGTATAFSDLIAGIYLAGTTGKFHAWNKDIHGPSPTFKPDTIVPAFYTGAFGRPAKTNAWCDSINQAARTDVAFAKTKWFNIQVGMNFTTKKVDITITDKTDPNNTQTLTGLDFINSEAVDFKRIGMINTRSNASYPGVTQPIEDTAGIGNGGNADLSGFIDNLKIYQKVLSLGRADVTVKYQDVNGTDLKTSRVDPQQEVGLNYSLWASDTESFIANGTYYSYDPIATGSESVVVATGGSTIIVKFKATPATAGPYIWKGTVSEFFNEQDANFTTTGTNQLAYQTGNSVQFSDALAPIKEVTIDRAIEMGSGNLDISALGYTITSTSGYLTGEGNINVSASTKLGIINKMKGNVYLTKDTLTINDLQTIPDTLFVQDGTVMKLPLTGFDKTVKGNGGVFGINPGSSSTYAGKVTGVNQVDYLLTRSTVSRMNTVLDSFVKLNVVPVVKDTANFDTTIDYKYNAIHLGDTVFMQYAIVNPNTSGTTKVNIGELTGTKTSQLRGNTVRKMVYSVGGLNTNAVFEGILAPKIIDTWGGYASYGIEKVGKGTWTLTGNSPNYYENVNVLDGTLEVNGVLCDGVEKVYHTVYNGADLYQTKQRIEQVFVADTAKLKGQGGYIGANSVVINGGLEGTLSVLGSVTLTPISTQTTYAATTTINVDGTNVDKITVGGDLYYGGTLVVKVIGALPPVGDYQIFQFANYIESGAWGFDAVQLPSDNWSFNYATGVLTYRGGDTAVKGIDANKEVESIDYYDLTGKQITKNYEGFMILKVKYTDGTSNAFKTFKKYEKR